MTVYICNATFRPKQESETVRALAVLSSPGIYDVKAFIVFTNGMPVVYDGEIWDYQLGINSAVTVQSGAAIFPIE